MANTCIIKHTLSKCKQVSWQVVWLTFFTTLPEKIVCTTTLCIKCSRVQTHFQTFAWFSAFFRFAICTSAVSKPCLESTTTSTTAPTPVLPVCPICPVKPKIPVMPMVPTSLMSHGSKPRAPFSRNNFTTSAAGYTLPVWKYGYIC